ncbi:MAG: YceH family protein [Verrucomicrobiales bacterium]|nr:YceH family protein [Verrucomicrobiales bacterium]
MSEDEIEDEGGAGVISSTEESKIPQLTFAESRVLGCLLEKEATTPDNYPLTLNSLHSACNQSSNRHPVTDLGTDEVSEAMEGLRYKNLGLLVHQAGARVPKNKHTMEDEFPYMTKSQMAILCVLMLRGQQTAGEIRQRTERMHPFSDLEAVENQLEALINNKPEPLVKRIPAGGGRRVETFVHLLCGDVEIQDIAPVHAAVAAPAKAAPGRIEELEHEVAELKETVIGLKTEIDDIRQQLGI